MKQLLYATLICLCYMEFCSAANLLLSRRRVSPGMLKLSFLESKLRNARNVAETVLSRSKRDLRPVSQHVAPLDPRAMNAVYLYQIPTEGCFGKAAAETYNILVDGDGYLYEGRGLGFVSEHSHDKEKNAKSLGIAFILGHPEKDVPSQAAQDKVSALIDEKCKQMNGEIEIKDGGVGQAFKKMLGFCKGLCTFIPRCAKK